MDTAFVPYCYCMASKGSLSAQQLLENTKRCNTLSPVPEYRDKRSGTVARNPNTSTSVEHDSLLASCKMPLPQVSLE